MEAPKAHKTHLLELHVGRRLDEVAVERQHLDQEVQAPEAQVLEAQA